MTAVGWFVHIRHTKQTLQVLPQVITLVSWKRPISAALRWGVLLAAFAGGRECSLDGTLGTYTHCYRQHVALAPVGHTGDSCAAAAVRVVAIDTSGSAGVWCGAFDVDAKANRTSHRRAGA
jgi:hypothetical protein